MTEDKIGRVLDLTNHRWELQVVKDIITCDQKYELRIVSPSNKTGVHLPRILQEELERYIERRIETVNKELKEL